MFKSSSFEGIVVVNSSYLNYVMPCKVVGRVISILGRVKNSEDTSEICEKESHEEMRTRQGHAK